MYMIELLSSKSASTLQASTVLSLCTLLQMVMASLNDGYAEGEVAKVTLAQ